MEIIQKDLYQNPPPYEKLVANLSGACSRHINIQHRLVHQIYEKEKIKNNGGTILKDIYPFPGGRRFHFAGPGGNEFAVWSDKNA